MVYYRIALISAWCLCLPLGMAAQQRQPLKIEEATVFLNGAELVSTANISLAKGENEILFTNVAGKLSSESLIINVTGGVVVESAVFQEQNLKTEIPSPLIKKIKDSIEIFTNERESIIAKMETIEEQINVLKGNRKVGGENTGLSVAELTKMLDLINIKMQDYLDRKNYQSILKKKTDEKISRLTNQLQDVEKKELLPGGQILVKFFTKEAVNPAVTISYVAPDAGWTPNYDIFADEVNAPIRLFYKASVFQNSGVNWDNVRLSLSTGNPNEGVQSPTLNPWYLTFYKPAPIAVNTSGKLLKETTIVRMPTTEVNDIASINSGIYQSQRGSELNLSGSRAEGTVYIVDGVALQGSTGEYQAQTSINNYVAVDNSGVNTSFDIDLPYTIPSDAKEHMVVVKKYELPATYRYYAVPKLDKDAFLQAQITNWEDLNLLPGVTNIFYEGTYVGQGKIDVRTVKDTLTLSLGRDKKIVVKRERDTKMRSVQNIGGNVRETYAFTVSVRNTRKQPINLILQDQQPVSSDRAIVIEDEDTGGSEYEEKTGLMQWSFALNANETKKVAFGFTLKYPKWKTIILQR